MIKGDLLLESNSDPASLLIRFEDKPEGVRMCADPSAESKYVPGHIELHAEGMIWGYGVNFEGYYLRRFADELAELHAGTRDRTEPKNWDANATIRMTAVGRTRDRVRVEGRLGDVLWGSGDDWRDREPAEETREKALVGCRFIFNNLEIHRSDVIRIVQELNELIRLTGMSCEP